MTNTVLEFSLTAQETRDLAEDASETRDGTLVVGTMAIRLKLGDSSVFIPVHGKLHNAGNTLKQLITAIFNEEREPKRGRTVCDPYRTVLRGELDFLESRLPSLLERRLT